MCLGILLDRLAKQLKRGLLMSITEVFVRCSLPFGGTIIMPNLNGSLNSISLLQNYFHYWFLDKWLHSDTFIVNSPVFLLLCIPLSLKTEKIPFFSFLLQDHLYVSSPLPLSCVFAILWLSKILSSISLIREFVAVIFLFYHCPNLLFRQWSCYTSWFLQPPHAMYANPKIWSHSFQ